MSFPMTAAGRHVSIGGVRTWTWRCAASGVSTSLVDPSGGTTSSSGTLDPALLVLIFHDQLADTWHLERLYD